MTSWTARRLAVYRRDKGICQVCLLHVGKQWDAGHLIDRIAGGTDTLSNLLLMCVHCNRTEKPITGTPEAAATWLLMARARARSGRMIEADWRARWEAQRQLVLGKAPNVDGSD